MGKMRGKNGKLTFAAVDFPLIFCPYCAGGNRQLDYSFSHAFSAN